MNIDPENTNEDNEEFDSASESEPSSNAAASPGSPPSAGITDPFVLAKIAETYRTRLIERYGYREDELASLFTSDRALIDFYEIELNNRLNRAKDDEEDEIGYDSEDDFDLPSDEKSQIERDRKGAKLDRAHGEQELFPEDARVTPEEAEESKRSLQDLLDSEDKI